MDPVTLYRAEKAKRAGRVMSQRAVIADARRRVLRVPETVRRKGPCAECGARCFLRFGGTCGRCRANAWRTDEKERLRRQRRKHAAKLERLRSYYLRTRGAA